MSDNINVCQKTLLCEKNVKTTEINLEKYIYLDIFQLSSKSEEHITAKSQMYHSEFYYVIMFWFAPSYNVNRFSKCSTIKRTKGAQLR